MDDENNAVPDRLLDAAYDLTVRWGWAKVRMADIAKAAGFSRQTVYDQFHSRDELAVALAARELESFLDGVEIAMEGTEDIPAAVEAALRFALAEAERNPLARSILVDSDEYLPRLRTPDVDPVPVGVRKRIHTYVVHRFPGVDDATARLLGEVAGRLILSYVVFSNEPVDAVAARMRDLAVQLLQPVAP